MRYTVTYRPKDSVVPAVDQVTCVDITWTPQLDVHAYYPCSPACCYSVLLHVCLHVVTLHNVIRRVSSSSLCCNLIHVHPV